MKNKKYVWWVIALLVLVGGYFWITNLPGSPVTEETGEETQVPSNEITPGGEEVEQSPVSVLGTSAGGNDILAYNYGAGDKNLLFIGGIHGGYSWNTALVAYELIDYLEANPGVLPANVKVTVIPVLNPDGLEKVFGTTGRFSDSQAPANQAATVPGRFNANNVDLNRNFDCDWQAKAMWQTTPVSGGTSAFSEPEARALKNYIDANNPSAVVAWYSAVGGVFSSNCHNGILAETKEITNVYADASGYRAYEQWSFYETTGDAVNWMAKEGIPAISVLLTTHKDIEWDKNRAGVLALFEHFAE
ncbi:MAG: hypothetical protein HYS87_02280 [Candidatus Colwellbacteria bacterium]|nr:hypothetical protein [Candidatus Colwellbacteria bacterium]